LNVIVRNHQELAKSVARRTRFAKWAMYSLALAVLIAAVLVVIHTHLITTSKGNRTVSNESPSAPAHTSPTPEAGPVDAGAPAAAYPVDVDIIEYFKRDGQAATTEYRGRE
jgi:hypothetical protein